MLRKLELGEMTAAARVLRAAFDDALPWLAGLHTPEQDQRFFQQHVFKTCEVWGAFNATDLMGIIAFRPDWIDQLYVLPHAQRNGIGTTLLRRAQDSFTPLQLWTFQRNRAARGFYQARGFVLIRETDGADNEEREPDALYRWTREHT